jgi:hypothetical protein
MDFGTAQELLRGGGKPRMTVVSARDGVEVVEEVDGSIYARRLTALAQDHTFGERVR